MRKNSPRHLNETPDDHFSNSDHPTTSAVAAPWKNGGKDADRIKKEMYRTGVRKSKQKPVSLFCYPLTAAAAP